jgi:NADH-quinone oxidoreductase subunit F
MESILLRARGRAGSQTIGTYQAAGGWEGFAKALAMPRDEVTKLVIASELRGRGGAGFPTGRKWTFVPKDHPGPRYLICNADESEPGTFKDRELIEHDPHMVLEGIAIASYAIGANVAYIYIRGEFVRWAAILESALAEARRAGFGGRNVQGSGFDSTSAHRRRGRLHRGEETALIESSRASAASRCLNPRSRRLSSCSANLQLSTTSRRSPACPTSSPGAPPGSPASAGRATPGRSCSLCPATSAGPGSWSCRSA